MMTRAFLCKLLQPLAAFTDTDAQVREADGLDAVMATVTGLRTISFPAVILESKDNGYFSVTDGALDNYTQSLWIMDQVTADKSDRSKAEVISDMFYIMEKIAALLVAAAVAGTLSGLDVSRMTYYLRSGGPKCFGYELSLTFKENINLATQE
jgi:hypothetical protein